MGVTDAEETTALISSAPTYSTTNSDSPYEYTHKPEFYGSSTAQSFHATPDTSMELDTTYNTFEHENLPNEHIDVPKRKTRWQRVVTIVLSVVSITAIIVVGAFMTNEYMHDILHWHSELMHWEGIMVYTTLYLAVAFPFFIGYAVLNVGAGYLYGMWEGLGLTMAAVLFSCLVAHLVLQCCCLRCTKAARKRSGTYTQIVKIVEGDQAIKIITMTRMSALPLGMQNALFATSHVKIWKLMVATLMGLGPLAALWVYFGTTLHTLADVVQTRKQAHAETIILFVFEVLIMLFITLFIRHHIKKSIDKEIRLEAESVRNNLDEVNDNNDNNDNNNNNNNNSDSDSESGVDLLRNKTVDTSSFNGDTTKNEMLNVSFMSGVEGVDFMPTKNDVSLSQEGKKDIKMASSKMSRAPKTTKTTTPPTTTTAATPTTTPATTTIPTPQSPSRNFEKITDC